MMTKLDPIIAVKEMETAVNFYQKMFNLKRIHGGNDFAVLVTEKKEVIICLHKWGEHKHPTMLRSDILPGNGLILYFKTENLKAIRENVETLGIPIEEDIHLNPNSNKKEFSLRDNDGYYIIVTEYHEYEG